MTQISIVDGLGDTHTRVWPTFGSLPAPNSGAFAIVDDGTTGTLYVALSVGGVMTWVQWSAVLSAVVQNPAPAQNTITDTNTGDTGLSVTSVGPGIYAASPETPLAIEQTGATPPGAALSIVRDTSTPAKPILTVSPDGSSTSVVVDGYGSIAVDSYATLPTPNVNRLGEIARVIAGGSGTDTFWYCGLDAGTPLWLNLQGPTGATGAAGVTPQLRESGGYIQVSYDGGTTWSNLLPLSDITGPAGPAGTLNFPALPAYGADPVTFWMPVLASGCYLPWKMYTGYTVQVVGGWSLWGSVQVDNPDFISDYAGNNDGVTWPSKLLSTAVLGQVIAQFFDAGGNLLTPTPMQPWYDPLTVLTMEEPGYMAFRINNDASGLASMLWVQVTVTAPASEEWTHTFDFTSADGGFTAYNDSGQPRGTWATGVGWVNNLSDSAVPGDVYIAKNFVGPATLTSMDVTYSLTGSPGGGSSDNFAVNSGTIDTGLVTLLHEAPMPGGAPHTSHWSGSQAVTSSNGIEFYFDPGNTPGTHSLIVSEIVIHGTGADPF